MKLARKAIITIMTTLALLAGASVAAATTASAATTTAPSLSPSVTWYYWSSYGTLHACNAEGDHLISLGRTSGPSICRRVSDPWRLLRVELYVVLGHPPGS